MPSTRKSKKVSPTVLPTGTSTSTPATVSDTSSSAPPATTAASIIAAAPPTAPPDLAIPAVPVGFVPVNFADYRGFYPRAGQLTAVPGAIYELQTNTSYAAVFGPAVPTASQLVAVLTVALQWTALRVAMEAYLAYVKSFEFITWKSGLMDLDKLDGIYQLTAAQNPVLAAGFPELGKLLDVPKVIGRRGSATRARNVKENAKKAANAVTTPVTAAAAPVAPAPAVPAAAPTQAPVASGTSGTGGATH
jgi:hypothetical protein